MTVVLHIDVAIGKDTRKVSSKATRDCPLSNIPIEEAKKLLLANVAGRYHAAQRKCPHLGFNLCRGSLDGSAVVCPLHKASFDLETGAIRRDPRLLFIGTARPEFTAPWPARSNLTTVQLARLTKRQARDDAALTGRL